VLFKWSKKSFERSDFRLIALLCSRRAGSDS